MDKFTLLPEDTVLMLIDIQERLVPAMPYGEKVIQNTNILIVAADKLNIPIMATEQYPKGLGKTVSHLNINSDKVSVYEKITFNGCIEEVKTYLKQLNKRKIIIAGMETHICVFRPSGIISPRLPGVCGRGCSLFPHQRKQLQWFSPDVGDGSSGYQYGNSGL